MNNDNLMWRQLIAEREKFFISWRLAIAASIIFWSLLWAIESTFEITYDISDIGYGPSNLISLLISSLFGLTLATALEVLIFKDLVRKWPFRTAVLFKTITSVVTVFGLVLFALVLYTKSLGGLPRFGQVQLSWSLVFQMPIFWGSVLYWSAVLDLSFFFNSVHNVTGNNLFTQYTKGRFYKPQEQEKVFLFVDMDGSVNLAEKLGNEKYFKLLNEVYYDFSFPIQYRRASIYQYVGDEIVLSWNLDKGIDRNTCIKLFFEMEACIQQNSKKYMDKFGVVPSFKGAIHCGKTTVGEVGYLRTAILYSGDVINTAARLERLAGELKAKLVVSSALLASLQQEELNIKPLGEHNLSGISSAIEAFDISLK